MANDTKKINEIFNGRIFRIPDYQRGYAWEDEHRQAFWDDLELLRAVPGGSPHYTGLISLEPVGADDARNYLSPDEHWLLEGGYQLCLVVDGQQRLTTFVIFLYELLRRHKSLSPDSEVLTAMAKRGTVTELFIRRPNLLVTGTHGYLFGYARKPEMEYFFRRVILEDDRIPGAGAETSAYARQLLKAQKFFRGEFEKLDQTDRLAEYYRLAIERLRFNLFEVSNDFDVCMTFEAMNNRGKPLSDLEKLKSRVLYLAGLLAGKSQQQLEGYRTQINECWRKAYDLLGWNREKVLDDDQFLNLAWLLRYGRPGESRDRHLFGEVFTPKRIVESNSLWCDIRDFSSDLAKAAPCWLLIHNPGEALYLPDAPPLGGEACLWLRRLNRLRATSFQPLITAAMIHFKEGKLQDADVIRLLKAVERYVFVVFALADRRADVGRNAYFVEASKLYKNHDELDRIVQRIEAEIIWRSSADAFVDAVNARQFTEGFYAWDELRVVLFEYEDHLCKTRFTADDSKVRWDDWSTIRLGETVEHIYPQTADDPYWVKRFGSLESQAERGLRHALGNLLLLSRSKNASLQNAAFCKKAFQGDECYRNGSFSEIAVANGWEEWTPKSIYERTDQLLGFIGERWNVPHWNEARGRILDQIEPFLSSSDRKDIEDASLSPVASSKPEALSTSETSLSGA